MGIPYVAWLAENHDGAVGSPLTLRTHGTLAAAPLTGRRPLTDTQLSCLRDAYDALPRRSRYILTVRLGLACETLTLKQAASPLGVGLSFDRIRQLRVEAMSRLVDAISSGDSDDRLALGETAAGVLRRSAAAGVSCRHRRWAGRRSGARRRAIACDGAAPRRASVAAAREAVRRFRPSACCRRPRTR